MLLNKNSILESLILGLIVTIICKVSFNIYYLKKDDNNPIIVFINIAFFITSVSIYFIIEYLNLNNY